MTTNFQPAPTWADPMLEQVDPKTGEKKVIFNPVWLKWFVDLTANIPATGAGGGSVNSIIAGTGLTGGTITTTGTISVTYPLTSAPGTAAYTAATAYDVAGAAAAVTPTTLGLVIGTNVQAYNANLTAINQALTTTSSPSFTTVTASL